MRLADEVAAALEAARGELAEAFHGDGYEVVRTERRAGEGGRWVEQPEVVVESGRCALLTDDKVGGHITDEQVVAAMTPHMVELPIDSELAAGDTIRINGRSYLVEDVKRGGCHRLFVRASVRERGSGG